MLGGHLGAQIESTRPPPAPQPSLAAHAARVLAISAVLALQAAALPSLGVVAGITGFLVWSLADVARAAVRKAAAAAAAAAVEPSLVTFTGTVDRGSAICTSLMLLLAQAAYGLLLISHAAENGPLCATVLPALHGHSCHGQPGRGAPHMRKWCPSAPTPLLPAAAALRDELNRAHRSVVCPPTPQPPCFYAGAPIAPRNTPPLALSALPAAPPGGHAAIDTYLTLAPMTAAECGSLRVSIATRKDQWVLFAPPYTPGEVAQCARSGPRLWLDPAAANASVLFAFPTPDATIAVTTTPTRNSPATPPRPAFHFAPRTPAAAQHAPMLPASFVAALLRPLPVLGDPAAASARIHAHDLRVAAFVAWMLGSVAAFASALSVFSRRIQHPPSALLLYVYAPLISVAMLGGAWLVATALVTHTAGYVLSLSTMHVHPPTQWGTPLSGISFLLCVMHAALVCVAQAAPGGGAAATLTANPCFDPGDIRFFPTLCVAAYTAATSLYTMAGRPTVPITRVA